MKGGTIIVPLSHLESYSLTPHNIAEAFCDMDSKEQAMFFSHVMNIMQCWGGAKYCQQNAMIASEMGDLARAYIKNIAEHVRLDEEHPTRESAHMEDS